MKPLSLNRNQLKYLAVAAMLIDHLAWAFVPTASLLGQGMHLVGRLTGPMMAFFVAEGYLHTRSVKQYLLRMGLFAGISWPAFSLFETGYPLELAFGVIYTLFLGLLAILLWDKSDLPHGAKVTLTVLLCLFSLLGDWPVFDVLWPLFFVLFREDDRRKWRAFYLVALGTVPFMLLDEPWWSGAFQIGVFAVPLLLKHCYNGEGGSRAPFHKWFFYVFYPLHLLILGLMR